MTRRRPIVCVVGLAFALTCGYVGLQRYAKYKDRAQCVENMNMIWNYARSLVWLRSGQGAPTPTNLALPNVLIDGSELIREFKMASRCPSGGNYPSFLLYDGPRCPAGHEFPQEKARVWRFTLRGPTNRNDLIVALSDPSASMRHSAMVLLPACAQHGIVTDNEAREIATRMLDDPDARMRAQAKDAIDSLNRR